MSSKYRYLIPNGITFISLTCGIISILLSAIGHLNPAGALILASYILDLFDGAAARRFKAGSEFGLQLDSLVDMVSLGTAPAVLVFMHLKTEEVSLFWVWPVVVAFPLAGAFRLARFNLLPPKKSGSKDSTGLTISSGGATLALAVLADLATPVINLPDLWFVPLTAIVCALMVSTIPFPSFLWVFSSKRKNAMLIVMFAVSLMFLQFPNAWFMWHNTYLGVSLARASYKSWR
ncbi:MAG: CDP-alcohol phosphatidyltransferase family protein [Anaerolineales bacterium]|nr:CDP-alcohol phosphatidyltransferase family protein [Anaerolineales bacterium]MCA9929230.1 CDP-alcohol phosphatidyltransferase family protein [Anaerolineales bacterium]